LLTGNPVRSQPDKLTAAAISAVYAEDFLRWNENLHFMAKYYCHQVTKTQRDIQTKIFLCAFESSWQFPALSKVKRRERK
jgi:hypothetical protein